MAACKSVMWSVSFLLILQAVSGQSTPDFVTFLHSFGRTYVGNSAEYQMRKAAFEKNEAEAAAQNKNPNRLWTAGVNDFWDWTLPEMSTLFGWQRGARPDQSSGGSMLQSIHKTDFLQKVNKTEPLPVERSWADLKTMQTIKNQGACGSCWAIAAVTLLETATEIHSKHRTFSAQEIVSCVPNPQECGGEGGCRGATVELAVDWVMKKGLSEEAQAPYFADDRKCTANTQVNLASKDKKNIGGASFGMYRWETLPLNKYDPLMRSLAFKGPTAVSVDASPWHLYEKGIFNGCPVNAIINHAVVAIGYGVDKANPKVMFWDIQNSWGSAWGEKGRIRLLRKDDDDTKFCGIDDKPELGTGCKGGPPKVKVCGMCGVLFDSVMVHIK